MLNALSGAHTAEMSPNIPGEILFWPPARDNIEARLQGILEGLFLARAITSRDASDWAMRFRVALDPTIQRPLVEVAAIPDPWPESSLRAVIDLKQERREYKTGALSLTSVKVYAEGITLNWTLGLSEAFTAANLRARNELKNASPDFVEFHLARTFLPDPQDIRVLDARDNDLIFVDMHESFLSESQIEATTRFTPRPESGGQLSVSWVGLPFNFTLDELS
jgi:hypothetical protein